MDTLEETSHLIAILAEGLAAPNQTTINNQHSIHQSAVRPNQLSPWQGEPYLAEGLASAVCK